VKSLLVSLVVSAVVTLPALAALKEGQAAPEFSAPAALAGKEFNFVLKEALQRGPVVVYFYPSAYTSGCNIQAHTFALKQAEFKAAGASIVGVSLDSIGRLKDFSADPDYCAGKIPVASDKDGRIARSYDLEVRDARPGFKDSRGAEIDHGFAERTTFIVTPDGRIAATIGGMKPADNVDAALAAVARLAAAKKSGG
jgi:peroxiredoxin Q/BCP